MDLFLPRLERSFERSLRGLERSLRDLKRSLCDLDRSLRDLDHSLRDLDRDRTDRGRKTSGTTLLVELASPYLDTRRPLSGASKVTPDQSIIKSSFDVSLRLPFAAVFINQVSSST